MATRSRSSACPQSPLNQGELGPTLPAAADESTSLEPKVYGEISLGQAISLIMGLQNQVLRLKRELEETKEATKEAQDWMGAVNQALTCIEARGGAPHTPEDQKPPAVKATPRPLPKTNTAPAPSAPLISWANPSKAPPTFAQPTPEVLSFLLMNMKDVAGAWAHPHLDQLGSHRALIQTVDEFKTEFLAAFGNPDATQAAKRQITQLTQTGTCAEYITKFRTIAMDLDWNNAALCGQFARGLHWEVSRLIATQERRPTTLLELQNAALVIDNALCKERASHPPKGSKSGTSSTPNRGASTGQQATRPGCLSSNPNFVSEEEQNRHRAKGLCINSKISPLFTISITPEKKAESLEVLIDSGATSSFLHPRTAEALCLPLIDLPSPRTVTMLNGSSPQAGKIWKKANLTFSFNGKYTHNPDIDWNQRTLSFPHAPPEHVVIAEEEEADQNPLEGVPSKYHQYAKLTEEGPLNSPLYSMTDAKSATLKDWLRDELKAGKIRPSKSSISSPVMFIPKKDGSRHNLMAQLRGAKVFTKLDLRWGYNNVQVKEGDKWKTAFQTKYGLYKSLVMTFGLTNAPAAFQHFMNKLFKDLLDVCVIIYLDDILIYSKDDASHTHHVHKVLKQLMENQLFCKASKCTFHVTSVEYLGIIVSDKGFSLDKLKIQAVQEWPVPTKVKEVQSFLGFANFLCRFVANFSHLARPLHNLVKKETPWKWGTKEQEAFQGLKDSITNALVLCHADPSRPYFLETDASGAALGSILSQQQEDGRLHPLGFLSESFKGAKQNYDTHNKELLAIIRSFEYWQIFLEGTLHPITVFTNHQNLEYWKESRTFNRRHARWHLLLAGYNFQIVYRPGKQLGKPDALSRQSDHADVPPGPQSMLPDQDKSLEEILQFLQSKSKAPPSIKRAFKDYEMEAGLLFYQGQIVVPDVGTLRTDLLRIFHNSPLAGHLETQSTQVGGTIPGKRMEASWHAGKNHIQQRRVFNNKFLRALYKRLGIDPHFSSAYHPQSNGQTERVNPSIKHFLRAYSGVNQRDWTKWLPMAEFAYNNAVHSSTGKTPFKALYGWEPTLTPSNVPTDVPEADNLAQTMEDQWKEVELALRQSKQQMIAGEGGSPTEFKIGEEAWLDAKNVNLRTLSPKLTEQRLGPFKVIEKISNRAYRLELPPTMRIHNVFYVGLLSKVKRDKKRAFENCPPPVTVDGEEEYEVEGITDAEERDGKWFF
ncbi:hypothetical protein RHS01_10834 [Rhizoctonia solani]|uniref:Integrase catalytic domain-containing protein n=1 Tax=Rhizoctonia solani TaxID=456999 RepID=A0A8H7I437_9AGAM|nr:hypothetical protein RHS01_10834 [Rhizoctonia solani]